MIFTLVNSILMNYDNRKNPVDAQMFLTPQKIRWTLLFWLFISIITIVTGNFLPKKAPAVDLNDLSTNFYELSAIQESTTNLQELIDFKYYADQITEKYFENINDHIDTFSNFGSRVTGYPGYEHALNYIKDFFRSQNLSEVKTVSYPLQIPYDRDTRIIINGENFTAHALAPNSVHTCKILDLSGILTYGGSGTYSDLDGKKIENSIVVLEFNSQDNWINVVSLGAKAVIYLPPDDTDRYEAELKSLDIPLNFPRIYINNKTTANTIKQLSVNSNKSITLFSDVEWVPIQAKNVMGILPGLDDDIIIISAHFDSTSVVPSIAPGSDEACGIATLLELIHLMRDENIVPKKTIMFLALSGHNQAAAGAREFVSQNYDILNTKGGIKLFLSLDLSASNNKVGINPYGYLYKFRLGYTLGNNLYSRLKTVGEDFLLNYAATIREVTGHSFEVESYINLESFEYIAPISFIGDHEPFIASNVLGLSFYTAESRRLRFNTPFDVPNHLQPDVLKSQVVYSICALLQLFNEENLGNFLDLTNKDFSLILNMHVGFGNIEGYCKEYDKTTTRLTNVANAVIRVVSRDKNTGIQGRYPYYAITDENGFYQVRGISSSQADNPLEFSVEAYSFDSEGRLIKANDLGEYGEFFQPSKRLVKKEILVNPTVFSCGTIGLFGVSHPIDQSPSAELLSYQILDPGTKNLFFSYGYLGTKSVSLVFIPPNTPSLLVGELPAGVLGVYATNSSTTTLRGNGFQVQEGDFKNLGFSPLITSKDLLSLSQTYIDMYSSRNIYDNRVEETFQRASTLVDSAVQLMKNFEYSEAIKTMSEAHIWSYDSLKQSRNVIGGGISSALLIAILLIPFSLMVSLLLFNFNSLTKWTLAISSLYALSVCFFYIIHPAFQLIPHLLITLIGLINVVSVIPVIFFLGQEGYNFLKNQRENLLGSHFSEINRTSAILIAIKTGVSSMKNHKIRTLLTLSGISLLTFSLTLFTSASFLVPNNFIELALPIVIAILLMINTSISVVYHSKREISIFTSLGLTPTQIVDLFLTEFLMTAVIGLMIGYFGGITFIRLGSIFGVIPGFFPIDYSSGAVVTVLTFSMLGMLLSIIYPLRMSGQMSVPSLKRTWELTSLPEEDGTKWTIPLPFIAATEPEAEGIIGFLREYFLIYESDSVGGSFFVRKIFIKHVKGVKKELTTTINLAPFDMGIIQTVNLIIYFDKMKKHWAFTIELIRLEGPLNAWISSVRRFIGNIRNQLLLWRALPLEEKIDKIGQVEHKFS